MRGVSHRKRVLLAVCGVVVLVGLLGVTGPGAGSDTVSIFQYEPSEFEAEQGETVTVGIQLFAGGASHDIGVDRVAIEARYDDEALTLQDVEQGEWMERGEETSVEMDVDESEGGVVIRQVRDPPAGGVTGTAIFAELTFEVGPDAEPGEYNLFYGDSEVQMVNDWHQPVFTHNATLTIEEGETVEGGTADDRDGEGDSPGDEERDADGDTPLGFGLVVAGLGVLALVSLLLVRHVLG